MDLTMFSEDAIFQLNLNEWRKRVAYENKNKMLEYNNLFSAHIVNPTNMIPQAPRIGHLNEEKFASIWVDWQTSIIGGAPVTPDFTKAIEYTQFVPLVVPVVAPVKPTVLVGESDGRPNWFLAAPGDDSPVGETYTDARGFFVKEQATPFRLGWHLIARRKVATPPPPPPVQIPDGFEAI